MSKQRLVLSVLVFVVLHCASSFTVHDSEEDMLPEMLRPIVRGGSWFDDMAVERLEHKHDHDGLLDDHHHTVDSEELFILKKLGLCNNGTKNVEHKKAEHVGHHVSSRGRVQPSISKSQSSEEEEKSHKISLKNAEHVGHHVSSRGRTQPSISKHQSSEEEEKSHKISLKNSDNLSKNNKHHANDQMTTEQFMVRYEKQLQDFLKKFMGQMTVVGVNIEHRIDSSKDQTETGSRTNILQV